MPHQSHSQITYIPYACLRFFSLHFSCPTNQSNELGYSHTLINAPSTSPCLLYTLPIYAIIIFSTKYYRIMSAVDLRKDSNTTTKANFSSEFVQTVLSWISGFRSSYRRARNMCNIEWFLRNIIQIRFNGQMNFFKYLIIANKSSVYIKTGMFFIFTLSCWNHDMFVRILPGTYRVLGKFHPSIQYCSSLLHCHAT